MSNNTPIGVLCISPVGPSGVNQQVFENALRHTPAKAQALPSFFSRLSFSFHRFRRRLQATFRFHRKKSSDRGYARLPVDLAVLYPCFFCSKAPFGAVAHFERNICRGASEGRFVRRVLASIFIFGDR
jgi:hypothetical protein